MRCTCQHSIRSMRMVAPTASGRSLGVSSLALDMTWDIQPVHASSLSAGVRVGAGPNGRRHLAVRGWRGSAVREDLCRGSQRHVQRDLRGLNA